MVLFDQVNQPFHGIRLGDVEFDGGFADVQIDFIWRAAHIPKIRVRHFAGTIHNASHNSDLDPFEVVGGGPDPRGRLLQVEQRSSAGRTGNVVRFKDSGPAACKIL